MKKTIQIQGRLLLIAALMIVGAALLPTRASAATVYLEASRNTVSVGDTVIVSAKINAEGVTINTVDGAVALKSGASNLVIKEFSLANSSFGLWPRTPSLSKEGTTVTFVGGVPGGFNIEGATLFKIIFEAKKEGKTVITPQDMIVFASDGKGTKLPVKVSGLTINVTKKGDAAPTDEWGSIVASDVQPPEDFIIVLGQDKGLFDNKKFAFFSALDNQSGVSYYEVAENGRAPVRSGSTYVLQDQDKDDVKLDVTAFDKAGNKKMAHYPLSTGGGLSWPWIVVIVVVLVIAFVGFKKWKKNAPAHDSFAV